MINEQLAILNDQWKSSLWRNSSLWKREVLRLLSDIKAEEERKWNKQ